MRRREYLSYGMKYLIFNFLIYEHDLIDFSAFSCYRRESYLDRTIDEAQYYNY
jgi:hypothetical protein